jgi:hypothetical protein
VPLYGSNYEQVSTWSLEVIKNAWVSPREITHSFFHTSPRNEIWVNLRGLFMGDNPDPFYGVHSRKKWSKEKVTFQPSLVGEKIIKMPKRNKCFFSNGSGKRISIYLYERTFLTVHCTEFDILLTRYSLSVYKKTFSPCYLYL